MSEWKRTIIVVVESVIAIVIGLLFTVYALEPTYEQFGINVHGNLWVVWFAVSILQIFHLHHDPFSYYKLPIKRAVAIKDVLESICCLNNGDCNSIFQR